MRRVLTPAEFATWLGRFLPQIPASATAAWLPVGVVTDRTDPRLAHIDGLNLSRAWMLEGILAGLPESDPRRPALQAAADAHRSAGLVAVTGEHYEGGHWLGTFATCLSPRKARSTAAQAWQAPRDRSAGIGSTCRSQQFHRRIPPGK
jgi:hypothetical protein